MRQAKDIESCAKKWGGSFQIEDLHKLQRPRELLKGSRDAKPMDKRSLEK